MSKLLQGHARMFIVGILATVVVGILVASIAADIIDSRTVTDEERRVATEQFEVAKAREGEQDPAYVTVYVDVGETDALLEIAAQGGYSLLESTHFMGGGVLVFKQEGSYGQR